MLCVNSRHVYALRHKFRGLQVESIRPQSAMQPGRLCVSDLPVSLGLVVLSQNLSWVHPPALVLSEMPLNPRRLHGSPARETASCTEQ